MPTKASHLARKRKTLASQRMDRKVLDALPRGVDLDLAQVTSAAEVLPNQARIALERLLEDHSVEVAEESVAGRPRYRRVDA